MKIDLHIHTKKVTKSELDAINISSEEFKQKMIDNDIGIAAITNHNCFLKDEFISFKNEKNYLLLPGIEYDVAIKDQNSEYTIRRQLNIIFSDERIDEFNEKISSLPKANPLNPIPINVIIENFDTDTTIFYLDKKSNEKTCWNNQEYEEYFGKKESPIKGVCLFDVNKIETHFILMAHKYNSLIGSDVKDWQEYSEKAEKLIGTSIPIASYKNFISILKMENSEILTVSRGITKIKPIFVHKDKKYELSNIFLTNGVNVIFGAKSTGKSELLCKLYNELSENNNCFIYKSEDYQKNYEQLVKIQDSDKEYFKEEVFEFTNTINLIKEYKEERIQNFQNFYLCKKNRTKSKWDIKNTSITNINKPNNVSLINYIDNNKESIKNLNLIDGINDVIKARKKKIIEKHENLLNETIILLKEIYILKNKDYIFMNIKKKVINAISKILLTKRYEFTIPTEIGLYKLFESRKKLLDHIQIIKNLIKQYSHQKEEFKIPSGNTLLLKHDLYFLDWENAKKCFYWMKKLLPGFKEFAESIDKLFKLDSKFKDPKNEIKTIKEFLISKSIDVLYSRKNNIYNNNDIYEPSNGEKAFIALFSSMKKEEYSTYFFDEPGTYLGNEMITETLIKKIRELIIAKKKIVLTTHRSSLGINTIPFNFIYRDIEKWDNDVYKTYIGYFGYKGSNQLISLCDSSDKLNIVDLMLKYFEGSKEEFNFRKDIYESGNKY